MKYLILAICVFSSVAAADVNINISLASDSESEKLKKDQVIRVVEKYDLTKWWFTSQIKVDEKARRPHSHPILTLVVRRPNADLSLLSQLLHEQIHWFEDSRKNQVEKAIIDLKVLYPEVPKNRPSGAKNERSTYLHLAVCLLELDALTEILGEQKARDIITNNSKYFYKWIYKTVLEDTDKIRSILTNNDLYIQ